MLRYLEPANETRPRLPKRGEFQMLQCAPNTDLKAAARSVALLTLCGSLFFGCGPAASHIDGSAQGDVAVPSGGPDPYAGVDIDYYPGDSIMLSLVATRHVAWTGFYLYPAPDHSAPDPNKTTLASWMDKRQRLINMGLGIAPIYVGKQPSWTSVLSDATGANDGADAANLAQQAGFPAGSVIYLDIEPGGPYAADFMTYVLGWISGVINSGYYPGVYVHSGDASQIVASDSRPLIWSVNLDVHSCNTGISLLVKPSDSGYANATAWQYAQNCSLVVEGKSWTFDFDVASTPDPSIPPSHQTSITVTSPSAGASWQIGQPYSASWSSSGVSSPLRNRRYQRRCRDVSNHHNHRSDCWFPTCCRADFMATWQRLPGLCHCQCGRSLRLQ